MDKLIEGIVEFRERMLPRDAQLFENLALTQTPDALFVTCSDSRVVPDLLASTHPGDLIFTMRNVGNLVPPATAEGFRLVIFRRRARSAVRGEAWFRWRRGRDSYPPAMESRKAPASLLAATMNSFREDPHFVS
jgi:hypothetical protein